MRPIASKRTLGSAVLVALLFWGLACNDHELNPYGSVVRVGAVDRTEQGEVRAVDILFVVDNSNSMCEEQKRLQENFDQFIQILATANADFHLAVVNSDMTDLATGIGQFRSSPGTYIENAAACSEALPDTNALCSGKQLPVFLKATDYGDLSDTTNVDRLQSDFACMALTGIDGDSTEMGLEAMRAALSNPAQQEFLRPGALLAVVFVTDENDCSDTTIGAQVGPVYPLKDEGCEYNRNIEDSCVFDGEGPTVDCGGEQLTARACCIKGDRAAVQASVPASFIKCEPGTGCSNLLVARRDFFDFLLDKVAAKNGYEDRTAAAGDIIIAAIINEDDGVRFVSTEPLQVACGAAGTRSYRYQFFAEMFDLHVTAKICDPVAQQPTKFAESLTLIADLIGSAINSLCLSSPPMRCTANGPPDGEQCPAGEICCPFGQQCNQNEFLPGTDFAYRVCSGFAVRVEVESKDADGKPSLTPLVSGTDYTARMDSDRCVRQTGSPVEISFTSAPPTGTTLVISYPREVSGIEE